MATIKKPSASTKKTASKVVKKAPAKKKPAVTKKAKPSKVAKPKKAIEPTKVAKPEAQKIHTTASPIKVAVASDSFKPNLDNKTLAVGAIVVLGAAWLLFDSPTPKPANNEQRSVVARTQIAAKAPVNNKTAIIEVIDNKIQATPAPIVKVAPTLAIEPSFIKSALADLTTHLSAVDKRSAGFAGTISSLQAQIQQLKGDVAQVNTTLNKSETQGNKNLVNTFLGQMIVFLTNDYKNGTVTSQQINNIREFANLGLQDKYLVEAIDNLAQISPENGIVTLAELNLMSVKHQRMGPPLPKDLVSKNETAEPEEEKLTLADKIKSKFSDWVSISKVNPTKLPDYTHPWMAAIDDMQYKIVNGNVAEARLLLTESTVLNRDTRLKELGNSMVIYLNQQEKLHNLFKIFIDSYAVTAK